MEKILITLKMDEKLQKGLRQQYPEADFVFATYDTIDTEMVKESTGMIGFFPLSIFADAAKLRWVQLASAGTDGYTKPGVLREEVLLTNATGAYGPGIAEYMVAGVTLMMKDFHLYLRNQFSERIWKSKGEMQQISGAQVLIVGLGDIGREFGKRMKALSCHVTGIKRTPGRSLPYMDEILLLEDLENEIGKADIIANCLPSTSGTQGLFSEALLRRTKKSSIFINVGRGSTVDTDGLCALLDEGHFRGVCLDVTDPEPLPPDHKLWGYENVLITPHVSGGFNLPSTYEAVVKIALDNLDCFLRGKPLTHIVDRETGYQISNSMV